MVRRLKEDIREVQGGFPKRVVDRVAIDGLPEDAPELVLSRLLDEYRTAREERFASTTRRAQAAAGLLVVGLQQRLLSSIEAFARSLKVHRATVERQWEKGQAAAAERLLRADADMRPASPRRRTPTTSAASGRPTSSRRRRPPRSRRSPRPLKPRRPEMRPRRPCGAASRRSSTRCRRSPSGALPARRQDPAPDRLDPREPLPRTAALRQAAQGAAADAGTTGAS